MRMMKIYRVPVRPTKSKRARYKGIIEPCGDYRLIYVEGLTHEDAYRRLCAMYKSHDDRMIGCKSAIGEWTDEKCAEHFQRLERIHAVSAASR